MDQVARYAILKANDTETLERAVNGHLDEGWVPHGSPFVFDGMSCQAMVLPKGSVERLRKSSEDN